MLTRYHVAVPDFDGAGSTLLRSTVTGVAVLVSPTLHDALTAGTEALDGLPDETARMLREHFLVASHEAESAWVLDRIRTTAAQKKMVSVTLMTTGACNMACRYCFQNELLPDHKHFKPTLVGPLVDWVLRTVAARGASALMMHFYGGEPLVNFPIVEDVATKLRTEAIRRHVDWNMTLTTNGSLMTRRVADRLAQLGCKLAIISLDGPPAVQNHRRPLKVAQRDSFTSVLDGVKNALRRFDVLLRTNIDHQNKDQLAELVRILEAEDILHHPRLFHSLEAVGPVLHPTEHVAEHVMSIAESGEALARGFGLQLERGVRLYGNMPSEVACEHISEGAYTVDQHGDIFPCPGFVGLDAFKIGNVRDGVRQDALAALQEVRPWEEEPCRSCPFLPQCHGGCRSCAYIEASHAGREAPYHGIYCRREFFEAAFPPYLRAVYDPANPEGQPRRNPGAVDVVPGC